MDATLRVVMELPREIVPLVGVGEKDLPQELKKLLAFELVRRGVLTYGKAAEMIGAGQAEFIAYLAEHKVSIFQFTPDELRNEVVS